MPRDTQAKDAPARTFVIEPLDIMLHATDKGGAPIMFQELAAGAKMGHLNIPIKG